MYRSNKGKTDEKKKKIFKRKPKGSLYNISIIIKVEEGFLKRVPKGIEFFHTPIIPHMLQ
ncbi:hypothetical protein COV87_00640 [Candidatus Roizmanbacteria bacterium CG11_big_fil_rev_8_21_14_0_20_37_16]|uniref:Uncharacterized protein n=1 Tax=Candidatus Roizmanbacteria bacterium CG11_big_fil_rev_8_21_14_0_20_37_16 TaxID=1974857 RepID=A0A2H0KL05_9BACT|nr:MAG: hypothetical protein COV87_00640 [Candidatus Roizmanbacteria bacterium CG11_big_fil_rev_8_21_14_0_20_37_16]